MSKSFTISEASGTVGRPLLAVSCVLVAGCHLLPSPTSDELEQQELARAAIPAAWSVPDARTTDVEDGWLATFEDRELDALVSEAVQYNADLRAAAARVDRAAALARAAGADLYPAVEALGRGGGEMSGDNSGLEGGLLSASWELDVWGRVRYGARSASEQHASAEADFEFARQSLAALVARSWFLATEAALQRELLEEMVAASEELLELSEQRLDVGIGSDLDAAAARVSLQARRDSLREVQLAEEQALRALELLLGRYPTAEIAVPVEFRDLVSDVPAGLPSELLERRPDVIAARNRVASAFSLVQQARAARLPSLSLTGSVSSITSELFVLEERDNPVWSLGARILAPVFTGGELEAQVDIHTAEQEEALAEYVQTALTAFGEVENALAAERALQERQEILEAGVTYAEQALELAQTRYRVGSDDFRTVQEQQLAYLNARSSLIRVLTEQRVQRVNLYLALGGDFAAGS